MSVALEHFGHTSYAPVQVGWRLLSTRTPFRLLWCWLVLLSWL